MPWKTVDLMDQKLRFIHLAQSGKYTTSELCYDFGISRKTGHKYLGRSRGSNANINLGFPSFQAIEGPGTILGSAQKPVNS